MKLNLENYTMEIKSTKVNGQFIPRDLSWIDFNYRVLSCANNKKIPLNERMKFLAITQSNLNEFIAVRFASAYNEKSSNKILYKNLLKNIRKFKNKQTHAFKNLKLELQEKGLIFTKIDNLNKKEKDIIYKEYIDNIFPLLTPINASSLNQNSSDIKTGQICISVIITQHGRDIMSIVPIPTEIDSIYQLGNKIILIEDIILYFLEDTLFINKNITSKGVFSIVRDASLLLSHDESRFIIDRMNDVLEQRNISDIIFMETTRKTPRELVDNLLYLFNIPENHFFDDSCIINFKRFMQKLLPNNYSYEEFTPFEYETSENYYSLFDTLKDRDILLHHPYDSYSTVVKFIQHAANDPDVVGIKQTLYRVSSVDSPIVNALCEASRQGKKVSVLIEIKARFDEENNIKVINKLQSSGATIITGPEYLKTHCKMCVVIRNEHGKLKIYSHLGTGNYNESTSKIYTDLSYLTSKQKIGVDLLHVFNILSGYSSPDEKLQKISYSPVTLRKTILKCIDREISNVKKGKKAEIFIKVNSLSDNVMVNKLYEAADAGVNVYVICRGVCSIVPRKNIFIKSIVGRFLEHSRIYYFLNNDNDEYYISSADLLTRNLDKRIETLVSLKDSNVTKQLKWIIKVFKEDTKNSFIMKSDGSWELPSGDFDAHQWMIEYSDVRKKKKKWKKR